MKSLRERLEEARGRIETERARAGAQPTCNLLVISDVHLGESIKEHARIDYLKRMADHDRDLCDFLDYYAQNPEGGKPWRLVINGDFLDFLTVTVKPSAHTQETQQALILDEEEQLYGLSAREERAQWKFERIVDRHQLLFTYLADFVGRGHYLDVLYGNHDAEFYWQPAKDALVEALVRIFFGTEQVVGNDETRFASRIRFHEWFYCEPGRFYIEHGNQYDDFSSFRYRLCPVLPFQSDDLAMPASHLAIRYFVNQIESFTTHNKDNWTLLDFGRWMANEGWSTARHVLAAYARLSRKALNYTRQLQEAEHFEVAATHKSRLEREAARYNLSPDVVAALDGLRHDPVHYTTGGTIQGSGLDQWGFGFTLLLLAIGACFLPTWYGKLIGLLVVAILVMGASTVLRWVRDRFLGGAVEPVIAPKLTEAGRKIAGILDVRYVLMGHSHKPLVEQVSDSPPCWYINSGSWLAGRQKERHDKGQCQSPLTYVVLRDGSPIQGALMRWCQRSNRPEVFKSFGTREVAAVRRGQARRSLRKARY